MAIHSENTPEIANSYVCGQHLRGGRHQEQDNVPSIFIGEKVLKEKTSLTSHSSVIVARVVPKPSDLGQGAEVGAERKSCNGDSSFDYFAHESRIAPEVADNVAAAVE